MWGFIHILRFFHCLNGIILSFLPVHMFKVFTFGGIPFCFGCHDCHFPVFDNISASK